MKQHYLPKNYVDFILNIVTYFFYFKNHNLILSQMSFINNKENISPILMNNTSFQKKRTFGKEIANQLEKMKFEKKIKIKVFNKNFFTF